MFSTFPDHSHPVHPGPSGSTRNFSTLQNLCFILSVGTYFGESFVLFIKRDNSNFIETALEQPKNTPLKQIETYPLCLT